MGKQPIYPNINFKFYHILFLVQHNFITRNVTRYTKIWNFRFLSITFPWLIRYVWIGPTVRLHPKYGRWTPSRTYLPAKPVLVHNTPISVCFAQPREDMANALCWEFGPPYFGAELDSCSINRCTTVFGDRSSQKTMPSRFSRFWHNPKFGRLSPRTVKISEAFIFWST